MTLSNLSWKFSQNSEFTKAYNNISVIRKPSAISALWQQKLNNNKLAPYGTYGRLKAT